MLHLQSRVHLHEVESSLRRNRIVAKELYRSRALVTSSFRKRRRPGVQLRLFLRSDVELR